MSEPPREAPVPPGSIRDTRRHQVFPRLDERQLGAVAPLGERRRYAAGAHLYQEGERHIGMFVVLSGSIEVSRRTAHGADVLGTFGQGMFTGEVGQLAGRAALATVTAREDSEILFVDEAALQRLVVTNADLGEIIMRAFILRRVALIDDEVGGATVIGSAFSSDTHRLRHFLTRNGHPHTYLDVDRDAETAEILARFAVDASELPVVVYGELVLRRPSNREVADAIGLSPDRLHGRRYDVAVVGAGPAGLAAAVYAASEGLRVVVLDGKGPGGQAGASSKIENYFGFPTGISGQALAGRGFVQAQKFGAEVAIPRQVQRLDCTTPRASRIEIDGGEVVEAATVVIATGARYRKPDIPGLERFEGRGVYYAASFMEAQLCAGDEVIVVGGGNSAGQAAVFLSGHARRVHVLVRAAGLAASMSSYLVQRIAAADNVALRTRSEVVGLLGGDRLERVRVRGEGGEEELAIRHVFLFLGADPNTAWVEGCLALDAAKFVKTGSAISPEELRDAGWPLARPPHRLETSRPGVFAVGDVRSGSVKRVATAVGEGAAAVQLVHSVLGE